MLPPIRDGTFAYWLGTVPSVPSVSQHRTSQVGWRHGGLGSTRDDLRGMGKCRVHSAYRMGGEDFPFSGRSAKKKRE